MAVFKWLYKAASRLAMVYMFTMFLICSIHDLRDGDGDAFGRVMLGVLLALSVVGLVLISGD